MKKSNDKNSASGLFGNAAKRLTPAEQEEDDLMLKTLKEENERAKAAGEASDSDDEDIMKDLEKKAGKAYTPTNPTPKHTEIPKKEEEEVLNVNQMLAMVGEKSDNSTDIIKPEETKKDTTPAVPVFDEIETIDETKIRDPFLLLHKYIYKSRLRTDQKLTLVLATNAEPFKASRITLLKKSLPDAEKTYGKVTALSMFGAIMIIGYSQGAVRLLDNNDPQGKVLTHKDVYGKKVTAIDLNKQGTHLIVGYENGTLALWDLQKATLIKTSSFHVSQVLNVKFVRSTKILTISSDTAGEIYVTEFSKSLLGMSANNNLLCRSRCAASLSINENNGTVAIAGAAGVLLATVEPNARIVWEYRSNIAPSKKCLPYTDWGKAVLPNANGNETTNVLAVGWERYIQLVEVKDITQPSEGYVYNGFYVSNETIDGLWWISESVIAILNSKCEITLLYTGNFQPGKIAELPPVSKKFSMDPAILELPKHLGEYPVNQLIKPFKSTEFDNSEWLSHHQTIYLNDRTLYCLCPNNILCWKLSSWSEFIEDEKRKNNYNNALRLSLKIFNGTLKGFPDLPELKNAREPSMRAVLKNFFRESLLQRVSKENKDYSLAPVAIEYCVGISAIDYLFKDMLTFFSDINQESIYVDSLETFILGGKFISVEVPQGLIKIIVEYYVQKGKVEILEKLLLNFNLAGQDLAYLSELCVKYQLYLLYIYVKTCGNTAESYLEPLQLLYTEFKNREKVTDHPLQMLYEDGKKAETGLKYIGYLMLYYIDLTMRKKKFPKRLSEEERMIPNSTYESVVYLILNWMFTPSKQTGAQHIKELMILDLKSVFLILSQTFYDQDLRRVLESINKFTYLAGSNAIIKQYSDILENIDKVIRTIESPALDGPVWVSYSVFLSQLVAFGGVNLPTEQCIEIARRLSKCNTDVSLPEMDRHEVEQLILGVLKNCKELREDQLNSLISMFSSRAFTEVMIYLREIKGEYVECLRTYLATRDPNMKVFQWLDSAYEKLDSSVTSYTALQTAILENLETLVFFHTLIVKKVNDKYGKSNRCG